MSDEGTEMGGEGKVWTVHPAVRQTHVSGVLISWGQWSEEEEAMAVLILFHLPSPFSPSITPYHINWLENTKCFKHN